jgi:ElaB/YqjD/DUF883 family membrane-anchored ribosome-binding protein
MSVTLVEDATKAAQEARFAVSKLAAHIISLGRELTECEQSWRELLHEDEARHKDEIERLQGVIHKFLDSVRRSVSTRKYEVPDADETNNAIIALFDAVRRNP